MQHTVHHAHDHDHGHDPGHQHGHRHHHGHSHGAPDFNRAFAIGVILNTGFVIVEGTYGFALNSLALLSDAGHNLSDVASLLLAWGAVWLNRQRASARRTYGYARSTIMASFINALALMIVVGGIAWEAVLRFDNPQPIATGTVMVVAAIGIAVNGGTALMFMAGAKGDLNLRGAFLHMAADAGVSLGVVIAAGIMALTGWLWLDAAISLAIVIFIAISSWGMFRESLNLSLDAVPSHIDAIAVNHYLRSLPGITDVHDLHIWPLSTTSVALTAHLIKPDAVIDDALLKQISAALHDQFAIDHATIQIEQGQEPDCRLSAAHGR